MRSNLFLDEKGKRMGLPETMFLLRQCRTLAEVLECLEDKKAPPEATSLSAPNVVSLSKYRKQRQQEAP